MTNKILRGQHRKPISSHFKTRRIKPPKTRERVPRTGIIVEANRRSTSGRIQIACRTTNDAIETEQNPEDGVQEDLRKADK